LDANADVQAVINKAAINVFFILKNILSVYPEYHIRVVVIMNITDNDTTNRAAGLFKQNSNQIGTLN
jgi:hypothetical protein